MTSSSNRMVVADPLAVFDEEGMIKLIAPAKVNLFLGIGPLRSDGFHEVINIMHALGLHDTVHMDHSSESSGGLTIHIRCHVKEGLPSLEIAEEENIVSKAIRLLAHKLGRNESEAIKIRIEKHIPFEAGLGGGSSNAAAALIGVSKIWGIANDAPEVIEVAHELGSDIAFFLHGGCACFTGKGELFQHALTPMKKPVVLIKPDEGVSTVQAYRVFDENPIALPQPLCEQALSVRSAEEVPLNNNLASAAEKLLPELTKIQKWAEEQSGIEGSLLTGSGSTTFVVCKDFQSACDIVREAKKNGWWARSTHFCNLKAAILTL